MIEKSAFRLFSFVTTDITGNFIGSSEHLYFAEVRICESLHDRGFLRDQRTTLTAGCRSEARGRRSKPLGEACAACLKRLARRFRQPRCVHISVRTNHAASKPLSTKPLLKGDSPLAGHRFYAIRSESKCWMPQFLAVGVL